MSLTFVAFDLETTCLDSIAMIIEIGCVRFSGDEVVDRFSSLINLRRQAFILYHRQSDRHHRPRPGWQAVHRRRKLPDLRRFLGSSPLAAQSAGFDLGFLRAVCLYLKNEVYDTFELASILLPNCSSYSLGALAAEFGIELGQRPSGHRRRRSHGQAAQPRFALQASCCRWRR
ncbi:MAG: 3'-5' exonuclease [Anaerolineae bacterium]|nr:3'-5' exonuclease [Anaerolineae bacterium]